MKNGTWWVNKSELDDDQKKCIQAPLEDNQVIIGPPGSGKTNLLLLRANYIVRAGFPNITVIVFTKQLKQFLINGADNYSFDSSKINTSSAWFYEKLREFNCEIDNTQDFQLDRVSNAERLNEYIITMKLSKQYDYILLDEVQDYLPIEIDCFRKLSKYIVAAGDNKQQIYEKGTGIEYLLQNNFPVNNLQFHYRNGIEICRLAEKIANRIEGEAPITMFANYNETLEPSAVEHVVCGTISEAFNKIEGRLIRQIEAYPDELIGVLVPSHDELDEISSLITETSLYHNGLVDIKNDESSNLVNKKPVVVTTIHSSKGLEFKVMHLILTNKLKKFAKQRNMSYTALTRAKTTITVYQVGTISGFLEQALIELNPPLKLPNIDDVFKH